MRALARDHVQRARALRDTITPAAAPAFLPVALVPAYVGAMERPRYEPLRTVVDIPQWRRLWILWRAAQRGGP
jgi:phytoene synthase